MDNVSQQQPAPLVQNTPQTNPPPEPTSSNHFRRNFLIFFAIAVLVSTLGAGAYFFANQNKQAPVVQSSPTPTPDPTADWKTYENSFFSFLYPSKYIQSMPQFVTSPDYPIADSNVSLKSENEQISITYAENFQNLTLQNSLGNGPHTSYTREFLNGKIIRNKKVNGRDAVYVEDLNVGQAGSVTDFIALNGDKILQITLYPTNSESLKIFDQILSTFKFTD